MHVHTYEQTWGHLAGLGTSYTEHVTLCESTCNVHIDRTYY